MSSAAPRATCALPGAGAWKLLSELALSAIAAAGLTAWAFPSSAECLYWSDDAGIWRANLDGSDAQLLIEATHAKSLSVDPDAGKLYWSDEIGLKRSDLDGANVEYLEGIPGGFADSAIDLDARKIYLAWPSDCPGCGFLDRLDLDTGSWEFLSWSLRWPLSIAIDPANDRSCACCGMQDSSGALFCSNLDGSAPPVVITNDNVRGVALDGAGSVYWIEPGRIRRARLDGSGAEDLVTGVVHGRAIALAPVSGEMYWVAAGSGLGNGTLERAFLDGSGAAVLRTGLEGPDRIALLPEPSRCLLLAAGLGSLLLLHRVSRPDNRPFGCAPSPPGAAG